MVVGDRLWLFSQTPNVSHAQPMLPTNDPAASAAFRSFAPPAQPTTNTAMPTIQSNRMPIYPNRLPPCNFLTGSDSTAYQTDFNKSETLYRQFLSSQSTAATKFNKDYLNASDGYFPPNQPKTLFNKLLWSNAFINKPMERSYDRFPFDVFNGGYNDSGDAHSDTIANKEAGGIAELERVFGTNADQRSNHSLNGDTKFTNKLNTIQETNDCLSEENSDVDCEQL